MQIRNKRTKNIPRCEGKRVTSSQYNWEQPLGKSFYPFINIQSLLIRKVNVTCGIDYSKKLFSKNSYHTETSELYCNTNQVTGFYMIRFFTERFN